MYSAPQPTGWAVGQFWPFWLYQKAIFYKSLATVSKGQRKIVPGTNAYAEFAFSPEGLKAPTEKATGSSPISDVPPEMAVTSEVAKATAEVTMPSEGANDKAQKRKHDRHNKRNKHDKHDKHDKHHKRGH